MEDFDIFTDEIKFTKPLFTNILNKYVKDVPSTPNGPNYECGRKLLAEECLIGQNESEGAFNFSESVSATLRTMAVYRDEQLKAASNNLYKITSYIKPVQDLVNSHPISKEQEKILDTLLDNTEDNTSTLEQFAVDELLPFYKEYMKFTCENNVFNFQRILNELPKEWTVIQLTAPYNPNENLKPLTEYRTEINSIYLSMFTNDYLSDGPVTVNIPANVIKEGEKPLFTELYSVLDDNHNTINNAQFLNNKRLVQNYWSRREDIDLRMKGVLEMMSKEWLGGFCSLLTGRLVDSTLRQRVVQLVDATIADWGFIKLTIKQKILLYNLIDSCPNLGSNQIKSCIRKILTEQGNAEDVRRLLDGDCQTCTEGFRFPSELCMKCLSRCFEKLHHFTLVDGVRAFSQAAKTVREEDEWTGLKKAKRNPVILIVDEKLDTFPWETLHILTHHPVSRMENIHFLYYLYKTHESDIVDGYFETKADVGRYVINPEKNLDRMEKRMSSFVQYWCGHWRGHVGSPPPPDEFLHYLTEADVFLYCGHGDGCRFANGGVESGARDAAPRRARGVRVLSGCGSVRLAHPPGRGAPAAAHQHAHIAGSPMVIGMLWEVTDLEVDKVVSALVALCVPSAARAPWRLVGKARWSHGQLEFDLKVVKAAAADVEALGANSALMLDYTDVEPKTPVPPERDILRAICLARASTSYALIASSVVARGLPVRVRD